MPHKKGHCLTEDGNIIQDCIDRMSDEEYSKHSDSIDVYRKGNGNGNGRKGRETNGNEGGYYDEVYDPDTQ
tara:strand:- start:133 stop:345 length:213 start_codon:yes stop_codon:yes gene_type:complete